MKLSASPSRRVDEKLQGMVFFRGWRRSGDDKHPHYSHLNVSAWTSAHLFCGCLRFRPAGPEPFACATLIESDDKQQRSVNFQVWLRVGSWHREIKMMHCPPVTYSTRVCFSGRDGMWNVRRPSLARPLRVVKSLDFRTLTGGQCWNSTPTHEQIGSFYNLDETSLYPSYVEAVVLLKSLSNWKYPHSLVDVHTNTYVVQAHGSFAILQLALEQMIIDCNEE